MKKIKMDLAGTKVVEKWKIWLTIPCIVILMALIAFGVYAGIKQDPAQGINIGIDFTGGNIVTVQFSEDLDSKSYKENVAIVEKAVKDNGGTVSYSQQSGDNAIVVRFGSIGKDGEANNANVESIKASIRSTFEGKLIAGEENIVADYTGPSASSALITTAVISVAVSTLLILVYIVIRFRNIYTGIAAVVALIHDVIMVLAFTMIFNIQINSAFIAAIITIIAYSINNTIVLFDRVRDNYKTYDENPVYMNNSVVNKSIAQTLSRSILTTITTMAAIVILAIIGVSSIREFALPVIFGLIAGAFSSIFFAPSLYCLMKNASDKAKSKKPPKAKKAKKIKEPKTDAIELEVKDVVVEG